MSRRGDQVVITNRKARHDYFVLDSYECGIVLVGAEVKSIRNGRANLQDGYARVEDGEIFLHGMHVPEYAMGTWTNHEPRRIRKLLLNRVEINRLITKIREGGLTLVPLSLYFENGWANVELALARGKKAYDKRQAIAARDAQREAERDLKEMRRR